MNKLIIFILSVLLIVIAFILKFNPPLNNLSEGKIKVITSFYPMYFFASQIGGNKAQVSNITPVGTEPHDYEPTTQQLANISNSQMLVLNGGNLEAWGDRIKSQLQGSNVLVVTAGDNLKISATDPHFWLDPVLAKSEVKNILEGFLKIDNKNSSYYKNNANNLLTKLDNLNNEYNQGLSKCQKKDFITSHEAFGYLSMEYHLNQISVNGISPSEEPSSQKLAEITNLVKKENIKIIFFESLVSPKLSQTLASETGSKTMVLDPIEGISKKDLQNGKNYFVIMQENLANLEIALECN